jgi:hypothetical protein
MGFKRPGVQIAPLGYKKDRNTSKIEVSGHFFALFRKSKYSEKQ